MSPVSVFRVRSLTPYLIGICALAVVKTIAGRKRLRRDLRLPGAWRLRLCSFRQAAGRPFHRRDGRLPTY